MAFLKYIPSLCYYAGACSQYLNYYTSMSIWGWPLLTVFHAMAVWMTTLLTIHRYVAVCHPYKAKIWCSMRRTRLQLLGVTLLCVAFEIPVFFDYEVNVYFDENTSTYVRRELSALGRNPWYQKIYKTSAYYVLVYMLPLMLIGVLTTLFVHALRKTILVASAAPASSNEWKISEMEINRIVQELRPLYLCFRVQNFCWYF